MHSAADRFDTQSLSLWWYRHLIMIIWTTTRMGRMKLAEESSWRSLSSWTIVTFMLSLQIKRNKTRERSESMITTSSKMSRDKTKVTKLHLFLEKKQIISSSDSNDVLLRMPCWVKDLSVIVQTLDIDFILLLLSLSTDLLTKRDDKKRMHILED
jgi:hypothetical protein